MVSSTRSTENMTHPSWSDMITECITTSPDGAKQGVSRPAIKKFVESKYHLAMNAANTSQLNRAITNGTLGGHFVLPKGPSGKVKLAPKRLAKENKTPKRAAATTAREPPVSTTPFAEAQPSKATRKYTSTAKKARVTPIPGRQVPPRKPTTRSGTKRMVTRSHAAAARARKRTGK